MRIVYVAGPFRAETQRQREMNARLAEDVALMVWEAGALAICPHRNSGQFYGAIPEDVVIEGYRELVGRCDALVLCLSDVQCDMSRGVAAEVSAARKTGVLTFAYPDQWFTFVKWLEESK